MTDTPETTTPPQPPPGTAWMGDWDGHFHDRVFGTEPVAGANVAALLTGVRHRNGSTASGVALRVEGTVVGGGRQVAVAVDLMPAEARELAEVLALLADRAEALDGI